MNERTTDRPTKRTNEGKCASPSGRACLGRSAAPSTLCCLPSLSCLLPYPVLSPISSCTGGCLARPCSLLYSAVPRSMPCSMPCYICRALYRALFCHPLLYPAVLFMHVLYAAPCASLSMQCLMPCSSGRGGGGPQIVEKGKIRVFSFRLNRVTKESSTFVLYTFVFTITPGNL